LGAVARALTVFAHTVAAFRSGVRTILGAQFGRLLSVALPVPAKRRTLAAVRRTGLAVLRPFAVTVTAPFGALSAVGWTVLAFLGHLVANAVPATSNVDRDVRNYLRQHHINWSRSILFSRRITVFVECSDIEVGYSIRRHGVE